MAVFLLDHLDLLPKLLVQHLQHSLPRELSVSAIFAHRLLALPSAHVYCAPRRRGFHSHTAKDTQFRRLAPRVDLRGEFATRRCGFFLRNGSVGLGEVATSPWGRRG